MSITNGVVGKPLRAKEETPFEALVNIPLEVHLTAYNNAASKQDILDYFASFLNPNDFDLHWRERDDDLFLTAQLSKEST